MCSEQRSSSLLATLSTLFFFFSPFGRATHYVGSSSALGAERPPDSPGKGLHRGLHQGGPFPSFPDVLVCLWGNHGEPFQLGLYCVFSQLLPGNTWHFAVLSLPVLMARHVGRAGLQQTRAAQRCLNKADEVQFVGWLSLQPL